MGATKNWLDYVGRVKTLRGQVRSAWCGYEDACGDNSGIYMDYVGLKTQLAKAVNNYKAFCRRKGYRFIRDDCKPLMPEMFTASETKWGFNRFEMDILLRVVKGMDPLPLDEFPNFWEAFNSIYRDGLTPARAAKQIVYLVAHGRTYNN